MKLRAVNSDLYTLRMGLLQRDLEKVQRSGPLLAQQVATFERTHNAHNPTSMSFLREAKELLQQYEKELPQLQRADQVKKAILKVKSQGSWFKLEAALAQGDAQAVKAHGDNFEREIRTFTQQYGGESLAGPFLDEAQKLLSKLHSQGSSIIHASKVKEEISRIRQQNDMTHLSMALNVRDGPKITQHGAAFQAQIQRFRQAYGNEAAARIFLGEADALLKRYERESPSILREDEVKRAISNFRSKSGLMAIQSAVHSQNLSVLAARGPKFEQEMNQFLSRYNTSLVYSTLIPPSFIEQLSDVATRYYKLMNIPRTFNALPPKSASSNAATLQPWTAGSGMVTITTKDQHGNTVSTSVEPLLHHSSPFPSLADMPNLSSVSGEARHGRHTSPGLSSMLQHISGDMFANLPQPVVDSLAKSETMRASLAGPSSPLFPSAGVSASFFGSSFSPYVNTQTPKVVMTNKAASPSTSYTNTSPSSSVSSPSTSTSLTSSGSSGYTNTSSPAPSASPAFNFSCSYVDSDVSSPSQLSQRGAVGDTASCPINPAYAPAPKVTSSGPVIVTSTIRTSSGGITEQEKITIEETKAKMKFREILFNELQVLSKLGSGQLGTVYLARWRGTLVAVKKLDEDDMDDKVVDLFKQEAAALHVLSHHPSLASFIGACCNMPNVCIVTQYYRYGSLEGALRGKTRLELTWKQVIKIAMEAASGILHLHKEGVLHSRISSRNILIGDGMRAYVNDFAFCHMKPKESVYTHTAGTSSFIGPVRYMSPDAMMHKYSEGSDAWSFGVLLWELWERREPFEGDDDLTVAFRVSQDNQTLPISPACPLVLATLMKQCWLDRPSQRPSFTVIYETLESYHKSL